jgi:hypothetical protein
MHALSMEREQQQRQEQQHLDPKDKVCISFTSGIVFHFAMVLGVICLGAHTWPVLDSVRLILVCFIFLYFCSNFQLCVYLFFRAYSTS